jgi:hypothetical protein
MLGARQKKGFLEYLLTSGGRAAPQWQLDALEATRWPDGVEPTAETFAGLQAVLESASERPTDRRTG